MILMDYQKEYMSLHKEAIIVDGTTPLGFIGEYYKKWIDGGATAMAPSIAIDDTSYNTINNIAYWIKKIENNSDELLLVSTADDIYRAKEEGKLGIIFHFQGTLPIELNLDLLSVYQRLGVRVIQLCYNMKNFIGDGCDERTDSGLSDFGIKVIHEMNRLGILVDLSHTGYQTTMEAIEISKKPVVFSHSNVDSLCSSPRNLKDDQIKAVANKGGVIGINGFPAFVAIKDRPTVDDFIDHIDYIRTLVGIEHVGISLDYWEGMASVASINEAQKLYDGFVKTGRWKKESYGSPPWWYPEGIEEPSKLPNLTKALLKRGYSEKDIKLVLGENFIRVYKEVWGK